MRYHLPFVISLLALVLSSTLHATESLDPTHDIHTYVQPSLALLQSNPPFTAKITKTSRIEVDGKTDSLITTEYVVTTCRDAHYQSTKGAQVHKFNGKVLAEGRTILGLGEQPYKFFCSPTKWFFLNEENTLAIREPLENAQDEDVSGVWGTDEIPVNLFTLLPYSCLDRTRTSNGHSAQGLSFHQLVNGIYDRRATSITQPSSNSFSITIDLPKPNYTYTHVEAEPFPDKSIILTITNAPQVSPDHKFITHEQLIDRDHSKTVHQDVSYTYKKHDSEHGSVILLDSATKTVHDHSKNRKFIDEWKVDSITIMPTSSSPEELGMIIDPLLASEIKHQGTGFIVRP